MLEEIDSYQTRQSTANAILRLNDTITVGNTDLYFTGSELIIRVAQPRQTAQSTSRNAARYAWRDGLLVQDVVDFVVGGGKRLLNGIYLKAS